MRAEPEFEVVTVASGARSLRSLRHQETFHPVVGPIVEARNLHAGQQNFGGRIRDPGEGPFVIWDVGLGAAANAIAALEALRSAAPLPRPVELHSFDLDRAALAFAQEHSEELGYFQGWEDLASRLLREPVVECPEALWSFHEGDLRRTMHLPGVPSPHAVLFDPYSPAANPSVWTLETFKAILARAHPEGCILTSYSRSTAVRVTLLLADGFVGRGNATGEKRETTVAVTRRDLLSNPLDPAWIGRVERSTAPGPLTEAGQAASGPRQVAARLREHPQFATREP